VGRDGARTTPVATRLLYRYIAWFTLHLPQGWHAVIYQVIRRRAYRSSKLHGAC